MAPFPANDESVASALHAIAAHPWRNLVGLWNWKSAALSALVRAVTFLLSNLHAGSHRALRAMLVEAAFAILASGFMGATMQRLRFARPRWATAVFICLLLPACTVALQFGLHHLAGTPHVRTGLIVSFCFAALASGFTWFSMQHGAMLAGMEDAGIAADLYAMPTILLDFVLFAPRALLRRCRQA